MPYKQPHILLYPQHNRAKLLQRWLAHLDYLVTPEDSAFKVWEARIPDTPTECFGYVVQMTSGVCWTIRQLAHPKQRLYLPHANLAAAKRSLHKWARYAWNYYTEGNPDPGPRPRACKATPDYLPPDQDPDILKPGDARWPWE